MQLVGENVVSGVFKLTDTVGLPLDIVVEELKDRGLRPAWDCYIDDARAAGWLDITIANKLLSIDLPKELVYSYMIISHTSGGTPVSKTSRLDSTSR